MDLHSVRKNPVCRERNPTSSQDQNEVGAGLAFKPTPISSPMRLGYNDVMSTSPLQDVTWDRMIRAVEKVRERLSRATTGLKEASIPYAVAGGNAVAAWISQRGALEMTPEFRIIVLLAIGLCVPFTSAGEPVTMKLWEEGTPTAMAAKSEATAKLIQSYGGPAPNRVTDVSEPTMTVYRAEKPNGSVIIVAPGGGYMFLSYAHEGTQVCEWLNSIGVTAVLLKYRTPTRDEKEPFVIPVQDAQRALGIVRQHASEWEIDPKKVGILGFSAGANLAGHVAWDRGERTYPQKAGVDDPRGPDFLIFIYGGGFLDKDDRSKFRNGFSVPKVAPPAFFLVAHDDKAAPIEAARLYLEYKQQNLPAELHIYAKGGHGFGIRKSDHPISNWPALCAEWMKSLP